MVNVFIYFASLLMFVMAGQENQFETNLDTGPIDIIVAKDVKRIDKTSIASQCGRTKFDKRWYKLRNDNSRNSGIKKRIIGGNVSKPGQWPWLVSLMFARNAQETPHSCGGSLINRRWILTAAHCFIPDNDISILINNPNEWTARVGEHNMSNPNIQRADISIEKIILYPGRESKFHYDIALMKLVNPVHLNEYVNSICLPNSDENLKVGQECYVAGWGKTSSNNKEYSTILRHVSVPYISNRQCIKYYGNDILDTMLCAGTKVGGKDACQFDSGGPLMSKKNGQWLVYGIVSFGEGCGSAETPGVYTRVSSFVNWIQDVIKNN